MTENLKGEVERGMSREECLCQREPQMERLILVCLEKSKKMLVWLKGEQRGRQTGDERGKGENRLHGKIPSWPSQGLQLSH